MRNNTRIIIDPASNGYVVNVETDVDTDVRVFAKRRQVMLFIGQQLDILEKARKYDMEEDINENTIDD